LLILKNEADAWLPLAVIEIEPSARGVVSASDSLNVAKPVFHAISFDFSAPSARPIHRRAPELISVQQRCEAPSSDEPAAQHGDEPDHMHKPRAHSDSQRKIERRRAAPHDKEYSMRAVAGANESAVAM
jgi:hypothetical protein